jgi:hypothetical protein
MCSVLLCLHVDEPVSGCEEGGSQLMQNTENFFMLCFVCSQLGAGQGTWVKCDVSVVHQMLYKK